MRELNRRKYFTLLILIMVSSVMFSILGYYWNIRYYHNEDMFTISAPPLATAMQGIHDKLYMTDLSDLSTSYAVDNLIAVPADAQPDLAMQSAALSETAETPLSGILFDLPSDASVSLPEEPQTYDFTTATDDYFADACFIGDSRTVGISQYAGIENATFLCKTSLSIYDYDKPKISYDDTTMSIHDILSETQFAKIYLMVGINECGTGTPETFYERYRDVVTDIRKLQPDALIFIQANLFVTQQKSDDGDSVTNENIAARNNLIATLANQKDIFYIDINESSLCDEGALVSDYTWDQVHVKAQYYPIWKDFLLQHAIVTDKALAETT
ncbi:MAG: hypothetical protein K2K74_11215 [Lachnospiraceae bacterium]|nr:hypothetical protein [Lachnospiraceae bacterium]